MFLFKVYILHRVFSSFGKPGEDTMKLLRVHKHLLCNLIDLFFISVYDAYSG